MSNFRTSVVVSVCALLLTSAGCTSARFAAPPAATVMQPQAKSPPTGGPYTREREDREFPGQ
jgi:hypothetical protein